MDPMVKYYVVYRFEFNEEFNECSFREKYLQDEYVSRLKETPYLKKFLLAN
jgi:hypothetical protein